MRCNNINQDKMTFAAFGLADTWSFKLTLEVILLSNFGPGVI